MVLPGFHGEMPFGIQLPSTFLCLCAAEHQLTAEIHPAAFVVGTQSGNTPCRSTLVSLSLAAGAAAQRQRVGTVHCWGTKLHRAKPGAGCGISGEKRLSSKIHEGLQFKVHR